MGAPELLDSIYKKLRQCLSVLNSSFDVHAQFNVLIRFINDNSSAPSVKVKEIILRYLQQVIQHMEPVDIINNADIRVALSKIINWSNEPKSIDMRKVRNVLRIKIFLIQFICRLHKPLFLLYIISIDQNLI